MQNTGRKSSKEIILLAKQDYTGKEPKADNIWFVFNF